MPVAIFKCGVSEGPAQSLTIKMPGTDCSVINQFWSPWCIKVYSFSASIGFGAVERPGTDTGKKNKIKK